MGKGPTFLFAQQLWMADTSAPDRGKVIVGTAICGVQSAKSVSLTSVGRQEKRGWCMHLRVASVHHPMCKTF